MDTHAAAMLLFVPSVIPENKDGCSKVNLHHRFACRNANDMQDCVLSEGVGKELDRKQFQMDVDRDLNGKSGTSFGPVVATPTSKA